MKRDEYRASLVNVIKKKTESNSLQHGVSTDKSKNIYRTPKKV